MALSRFHLRPAATLNGATWRRALWIALSVNAGFFLAEIVAGVAAGSSALQADALDFFGDAANTPSASVSPEWRSAGVPGPPLAKGATLIAFALWVLGARYGMPCMARCRGPK